MANENGSAQADEKRPAPDPESSVDCFDFEQWKDGLEVRASEYSGRFQFWVTLGLAALAFFALMAWDEGTS